MSSPCRPRRTASPLEWIFPATTTRGISISLARRGRGDFLLEAGSHLAHHLLRLRHHEPRIGCDRHELIPDFHHSQGVTCGSIMNSSDLLVRARTLYDELYRF